MMFVTGLKRIPPCGFHKKFQLDFLHDKFPLATASTCEMSLSLPTCHNDNDDNFNDYLTLSLKGHLGFGRL